MEPAKAVKEYKDQNIELQLKIDEYARVVGKITVERDWAVGKLQSLAPQGHFLPTVRALI